MKLEITYQESYSRGELLLRSFFGLFYITLPHIFVLLFVGIWSQILSFIAFWAILFTGRYPQSMFEFQVGLMQWQLRLNARLFNLSDGYPAFGVNATDEYTSLEIPYPESISRGLTLLRTFFGAFYVGIPHGIVLYFLAIAVSVMNFLAFWAVLFTGRYPADMHKFVTEYIRWGVRYRLYMANMNDTYPPFSGKADA